MALHQLFRIYSGMALQVVNVLGVVCEKLSLLLQKMNEFVSGRPVVKIGENVASKLVEDAGVKSALPLPYECVRALT